MAAPILLILGAGANIGTHVAKAFISKGYKVALTSRKAKPDADTEDTVNIAGDLSNPEVVPDIFAEVKKALGGWPSVVVYNGRRRTIFYAARLASTTSSRFLFFPSAVWS